MCYYSYAMKILVVSDSHGNDEILQELYSQYPNMDYYLHAGDSQSSSMVIYPFDSVLGNCDYYDFDRCRRIKTSVGDIFMKHFPTLRSNEAKDVKIFIHGHTHKNALYIDNDGLITLCPGSISRPRDGTIGSYVIINIENERIEIKVIEAETNNILKLLNL